MISGILKNYASLTSLRIGARVLQFFLKTYLIRQQLNAAIVGHMINLDIILTFSLHFTKSCLKPSYQRVTEGLSHDDAIKSGMNLMTGGIFTTFILSLCICLFQIMEYSTGTPYFSLCVILYGISALLQSIQQKYNTQMILNYQYKKSGIIEMSSFLPKTLFIFLANYYGLIQSYGILIFGIGQLLYSCLLLIITIICVKNRNIFIKILSDGKYIAQKSKQIFKQLAILSFLKMFLSEFQKFALIIINISQISSTYSLISNLGSIVVRYIFAPIQQISYNYFSRGSLKDSLHTMEILLRGLIIFGVVSLVYGYHFSESVLLLIYGHRWVTFDSILSLRAYAVLLCFMGINGIMQAFVFARGESSTTIASYRIYSIISTLVFLVGSLLFLYFQFGAASLFLGNVLSMAIRIFVSWYILIHKYYEGFNQFRIKIWPGFPFLILTSIIFYITNYIKIYNSFTNCLIGGILLSINLIPVIYQYGKEQFFIFKKYIKDIPTNKQQ